ncbi:MAG: hypothetical protein ACOC2F_08695, partial [Bacteroidota bacterium]
QEAIAVPAEVLPAVLALGLRHPRVAGEDNIQEMKYIPAKSGRDLLTSFYGIWKNHVKFKA